MPPATAATTTIAAKASTAVEIAVLLLVRFVFMEFHKFAYGINFYLLAPTQLFAGFSSQDVCSFAECFFINLEGKATADSTLCCFVVSCCCGCAYGRV